MERYSSIMYEELRGRVEDEVCTCLRGERLELIGDEIESMSSLDSYELFMELGERLDVNIGDRDMEIIMNGRSSSMISDNFRLSEIVNYFVCLDGIK